MSVIFIASLSDFLSVCHCHFLSACLTVCPFLLARHCLRLSQTTQHILQDCKNLQGLRRELWPSPMPLEEKLYGPLEALRKTTTFLDKSGLQV